MPASGEARPRIAGDEAAGRVGQRARQVALAEPSAADRDGAKKLLGVGDSPRDPKLDEAELAAWTTVASTILNLDETISKR
jgi:hypothetical protein